jgi:alkylated DNA repair dioxygenase AlkB
VTSGDAVASVTYQEGFVPREEADEILDVLLALPDWKRERLRLFGRDVDAPRLIAWYGDPGCRYAYSGIVHDPLPWPEVAASLRGRVQDALGVSFNGVLANRYRNGRDSMGWHSDDERELGRDPVIASLSFGAERRFLLRERGGEDPETREFTLCHGSLLLMRGDSQRRFKHSLPKTTRCHDERVNLTFRCVRRSEAPRESAPRSRRRALTASPPR